MAFLLHVTLAKEFNYGIKVLTYLKRQKGTSRNVKGRYVNIALISLQIVANLTIYVALIIGVS